jgi:YgiT-type zinc finger domain-containing protein
VVPCRPTREREWCELCSGRVEHRLARARFHFRGGTIYVDSVPAWVCGKCGEQYFDAAVYKRLEEMARHRRRIKKTVCFPLAKYNTAIR